VERVTWANWFGGKYGDGKRFFGQFAIDPESYLDMYPEMSVTPEDRAAFLQDRAGALVGERLLEIFGWKVGQTITLQGTIFPGDWKFNIRGVYRPTDPVINDDAMMFHWEYLDEYMRNNGEGGGGQAGWYIFQVKDPARAAEVAAAVDAAFRNSPSPTKTGTEREFNASFATMWGNVSLLMNSIGMAVVFAILLVTANAMLMSTRERGREYAVLKTLGFSDRRLFLLVISEAALIVLTGALFGLGGAKLLYQLTNFNAGGLLPGFYVRNATLVLGAAIALLLVIASGIVPAMRAARLSVVTALRSVE
ncbi:MAG TPA: FtsX-like permease family protein, partial [Gemmatimonadales bacterium]|nr:FtsX-like permease family protein [Gemmatimonadales bacterium]